MFRFESNQFKSGIILKNRVLLTPEGNESASNLLESIGIEDTDMNAAKIFVKVNLIPKDNNRYSDVKNWKYKVYENIVPDWYKKDQEKYEQEFRNAVEHYVEEYIKKENIFDICGHKWKAFKKDEKGTYYLMDDFLKISEFGKTNNYAESYVRNDLINSELAENLKKEFGDKLVPISLDLTSTDGFKDYGSVEGDILAIDRKSVV